MPEHFLASKLVYITLVWPTILAPRYLITAVSSGMPDSGGDPDFFLVVLVHITHIRLMCFTAAPMLPVKNNITQIKEKLITSQPRQIEWMWLWVSVSDGYTTAIYESRDVIRHLLSPDVPHGFTRPAPICLSVSRVISFLSILFTCLFPNRAHKEPAWTLIHCLRGLWVSDICGCKLREKRKRNGEKKYWRWKLETSEHYKPLLIPKGSRLHIALHVDITERSDWGILNTAVKID